MEESALLDYKMQELKLQAAIKTLNEAHANAVKNNDIFDLLHTKEALLSNNSKSPLISNYICLLFYGIDQKNFAEKFLKNKEAIYSHASKATKDISTNFINKLKNKTTIFIPYLSYEIEKGLSFSQGKNNFIINTIEHPCAEAAGVGAKATLYNIKTNIFHSSAISRAIEASDVCVLGAVAITEEGGAVCELSGLSTAIIAFHYNVPTYVCANSLKYTKTALLGNLLSAAGEDRIDKADFLSNKKISVPKYEKIHKNHISGFISEIGIHSPDSFIHETKRHHMSLVKQLS
ncbi:MAG: hypothetical protein V1859_03525 [archaeon]